MKKTLLFALLFLTTVSFAQDYKKEWIKVLEKESDGEVKQAAALTDIIYKKAKKDKNQPQLIKAFFFKSKYMQVIEEDAQYKIIKNIQAEIKIAPPDTKAILKSLYAQMLVKIYNKNHYIINGISNSAIYDREDYRQWGATIFTKEIDIAFSESLGPKELLYHTPLSAYDEIVDFAPAEVKTNRPLYDFLAEQYLDYLYNQVKMYEDYYTKNTDLLFGPPDKFFTLKVNDSVPEGGIKTLTLLREIEHRYYNSIDPSNLQRAFLRRLNFLDRKIHNPLKEPVYLNSVRLLSQLDENTVYEYKAKLVEARLLIRQANKAAAPRNLIDAVAILDGIIANKSKIDLSPDAINIRNNITNNKASITLESYIIPDSPSLASINFKNLDSISVFFYKIPFNLAGGNKDIVTSHIKTHQPFIIKKYALPEKHDHFDYSTEIILPPLPTGTYVVALSGKDSLGTDDALDITCVYVTRLSIVEQQCENYNLYHIADRISGRPVENAIAFSPKFQQQVSDRDGRVKLTAPANYTSRYYEPETGTFISGKDTLSNKFNIYPNNYSRYDDIRVRIQLYTDRQIYRPGQTAYFKGIAYQQKNGVYSVLPNTYFSIEVEGPRLKTIKEFRLKTNEFGSFSEKIELPKNLTGDFEITVYEDDEEESKTFWYDASLENSRTNFSVEEYKRPTFGVAFDKIKEDIRLNEEVSIKGIATAFSNAPITEADVEYTVVRHSRPNGYYGYGYERSDVIIKGDTETDAQGNFVVEFKTEPDERYDPEDRPVFAYEIEATVTDINGETHKAKNTVYAGYHALEISAHIPGAINKEDTATISVETENLNGQFLPATGIVQIYKASAPDNYYTARPWNEPEIQTISKKEFSEKFPYIPYVKIADTLIKTPVYTKEVNTAKAKDFKIENLTDWQSGQYELVFTAKDSVGNEVTSKNKFSVYSNSDKVPADKKIFEYKIINTDLFSNDGYVEIELSSGVPLFVSVAAQSDYTSLYDKVIDLNTEKKRIRIPVLKNPNTSMSFVISYVWQNQFYNTQFDLIVPRKMETISLETEALNSKLIPGGEQTWSFSFKGGKNPLEVLASMYDASLDKLLEEQEEKYYGLNKWYNLETNSYRSGGRLYKKLLTQGTVMSDFSQIGKFVQQAKGNDSFYMYGFDFDNVRNIYTPVIPKNQFPKKGEVQIIGTVLDSSGMPIPGANVVIEGTSEGIQTDFDGRFLIYAHSGEKLSISFVGMKSQVVKADSATMTIKLEDEATHMEELVVEAYRSTTRKQSSVAVTTVTSKTVEGRPNATFIQTLQGQVAGISISTIPGASPGVTLVGDLIMRIPGANGSVSPLYIIDGVPLAEKEYRDIAEAEIADMIISKEDKSALYGPRAANGVVIITTKKGLESLQQVKARKNFDETAFFYPHIKTDKKGKFSFSFTTPEALTEWKLRMFAHSKKAASGYYEKLFFTQKDLMVVPNMPRFLRERDTITLIAKVTNLTAEAKAGNALLQLFDAVTMKPVDAEMLNLQNIKPFTIPAKGNTTVSWKITVPKGLQGVQYKVLAKAGDFTDGEENILPVLTNSIMVTESIPLWVKPNSTKEYSFKDFEKSLSNKNISQIGMTLEYTSNPTWLALQSLPYLMEFEHDCSEQVFSRYYANTIATHVLNSNPKIAEVFDAWRKAGKPLSKFEQNEELKNIIMAETPWILENQNSEEIKNRLALLFDLDKMKTSLDAAYTKLQNKQLPSGGFPWFDGGTESGYITRHVAAGFGHLAKMGITLNNKKIAEELTKKAVEFMDSEFLSEHNGRISRLKDKKQYSYELPYNGMHYLYARSFYLEQFPMSDSIKKITDNYIRSMNASTAYYKMKWLGYSLYEKGTTALIMNRYGYPDVAKKVLNHLKEISSTNEEWGMYWIENKAGWRWYQAPVETHALLIEAFTEVDNDTASADAMKVWLLKNKQNKNWPTTKSTAEAVYALLIKGTDWLSVKDNTSFKFGNQKNIDNKIAENEKEAGTGYMKLQWKPDEIKTGMGSLTVENKSAVPGFGGFYWQRSYDEADKDYIPAEGILNITKELYHKVTTEEGEELQDITSKKPLKIGDLVTVRLLITAKEDMEYLHLKDMRASAFEPVNVISERKYTKGTSYYQSTRDAATHFFFDSLDKGVYVIEYDVRVNNAGDFSNGIATIQSMYAPEFSGNSKSIRIHID